MTATLTFYEKNERTVQNILCRIYMRYTFNSDKDNLSLQGFNMSEKNNKKKKKNSQMIIRINDEERAQFIALCESLDTSAAREVRHFIRKFIAENSDE